MKPIAHALAMAAALAVALPAAAHISYTGRDLGSYTGLDAAGATISNQAVTGNFGWADATDADFGDSHKSRAFRFHLDNEAWVTIGVAANATATATSIGGLLPGFSLYQGLAHVAPAAADHDFAAITSSYLASLGGVAREGAWVALGDWKIGNDAGTSFGDLSSFTFAGYAVDGTQQNYGNANLLVGGDGVADGQVRGSFRLGAGDYSLFVGGADYAAQSALNPDVGRAFGMSVALNVTPVPEADSLAMMLAGLAGLGAVSRRRRAQSR